MPGENSFIKLNEEMAGDINNEDIPKYLFGVRNDIFRFEDDIQNPERKIIRFIKKSRSTTTEENLKELIFWIKENNKEITNFKSVMR